MALKAPDAAFVHFQLWSSGLERWDDVVLSSKDIASLEVVHEKQVGHELYGFYRDGHCRWFRHSLGLAPVVKQEEQR